MSRSRSITSMLASAAAQGTGPPPKVLPRSPIARCAVTRGRGHDRADRQTRGETLGEGEDVGGDAIRLGGAEGAAPAHATLHFIEDEGRAPLGADPARGLQESGRAVTSAGEALHRLDDERGDRVVHRGLERGDVVERRPCGRGEPRRAGLPSS